MRPAMLLCSIGMTSFLLVPRITWQGCLQAHRLASIKSGRVPNAVVDFVYEAQVCMKRLRWLDREAS
jgi:hypothetical protein